MNHPQREKSKGEGLPATTCADDLFTRIDALKPKGGDHAAWPVRYYLGFGTPLPDPQKLRGDSWLWKIVQQFAGKKSDGSLLRALKDWATLILVYLVWLLGYWADIIALAKVGPGQAVDARLGEIKADIAAKELVCRIVGTDPTYATQIDQYARNYLAPTETLTTGDAVGAYLADVLPLQAVADYTRLNNQCPFVADVQIATQQARPGQGELLDLFYRGTITEQVFEQQIRQLGWLSSQYVQWMHELHKWQPDSGTVVSWMRLGTTREQPAKGLDLDRDFKRSYGEQEQKWARSLGLTEEQVRWLWRSQFQALDLGTAYDWFRRGAAGMLPQGATFGEDDLRLAIDLSSLPPAYRATAFAARWQPLSARLLRAAFNENVVGEGQVLAALVADGYSPADAGVLLAEWTKLKPSYLRRKIGVGGAGAMLKRYAAGSMGAAELAAELAADGFDANEVKAALVEARAERLRNHRDELVKFLKGRYIKGEVDDVRVQSVLVSTGLSAGDVGDLLKLWRTEFEVHPRQVSAGELLGWYKQGLMREAELVTALAQLRYTAADTARMIGAADLTRLSTELKTAETLVTKAKRRLKASEVEWRKELDEAEQLAGKPSQRTLTRAGQLLTWVKQRVAKKGKTVGEKGPPADGTVTETAAASAAAAAFVTRGVPGNVVPGEGVELSPAAPDATDAAGDGTAAGDEPGAE